MKIQAEFDCTESHFIEDIANKIYAMFGKPQTIQHYLKSQHPTEKSCLAIAEDIFEMLTGDSPTYEDLMVDQVQADPEIAS